MGRIGGRAARLLGVLAVLAAVWGVAWAAGWVGPPGGAASDGALADAGTLPDDKLAAARAQLARLQVKGRAGTGGYERSEFGQAWADVDRNGCDTRNDILARDLTGVAFRAGTRDCVVSSGVLEDPYTGDRIDFVRGPRSAEVQIDHVVALSDAWQKGAQLWSPERREEFANDPANLLAVDGDANQEKGNGDLATWLPQNKAFRCEYTARIVAVKSEYGLWMTEAEHRRAGELLDACGPGG
ncbi:HNH endonuclease family protein [Sinomonas mesophila]|uniref:HNH endonuclease family protein n=1 Tax=Sinomonas mesophila TaxID=1531955 RepID=UPI0009851063|nr:HNH endonuclease family protein [Sinomonas mesophila]